MPQFPNPAVQPPRPRYLRDLCEHQASRCHVCCSTSRLSCLQSAATLSSGRQSLGPGAQHHVTCSSWSIYLMVIIPVVLVGLVIIYWQCMKTEGYLVSKACGPVRAQVPRSDSPETLHALSLKSRGSRPQECLQHSLPLRDVDLPQSQSHRVMRSLNGRGTGWGALFLPEGAVGAQGRLQTAGRDTGIKG